MLFKELDWKRQLLWIWLGLLCIAEKTVRFFSRCKQICGLIILPNLFNFSAVFNTDENYVASLQYSNLIFGDFTKIK